MQQTFFHTLVSNTHAHAVRAAQASTSSSATEKAVTKIYKLSVGTPWQGHQERVATRQQGCRRTQHTVVHAEASSSSADYEPPEEQVTGSPAWRQRPAAITLPKFARKPEQTFMLAAFLKILLMSSTFPAAIVFKPLGYAPHGIVAWLLLVPVAAVLALLASAVERSNFLKRKGSGLLICLACALALTAAGHTYDWRPPVRQTATTAASPQPISEQQAWERQLFSKQGPRTAEDSDRIWEALEKDVQAQKNE